MERKPFNARSSFLIIYTGNGQKAINFFTENCQKRALCADRRPLRKDTIASHDRFRPMGARQNLALYYKIHYSTTLNFGVLPLQFLLKL